MSRSVRVIQQLFEVLRVKLRHFIRVRRDDVVDANVFDDAKCVAGQKVVVCMCRREADELLDGGSLIIIIIITIIIITVRSSSSSVRIQVVAR